MSLIIEAIRHAIVIVTNSIKLFVEHDGMNAFVFLINLCLILNYFASSSPRICVKKVLVKEEFRSFSSEFKNDFYIEQTVR